MLDQAHIPHTISIATRRNRDAYHDNRNRRACKQGEQHEGLARRSGPDKPHVQVHGCEEGVQAGGEDAELQEDACEAAEGRGVDGVRCDGVGACLC